MNDMCDFCGKERSGVYPFDPDGELNVCETCDRFYGPLAREVAFKVKENISKNMDKFLEQGCFYVESKIKAWVKLHLKELTF